MREKARANLEPRVSVLSAREADRCKSSGSGFRCWCPWGLFDGGVGFCSMVDWKPRV